MSENDLLSYLRHTKGILKSLSSISQVHVVCGNEACDLDSAVCAIVYAFYLHKAQAESSKVTYIPVLNIVQAAYALHTEVTYALQESGITEDLLIFRDQINLTDLHGNQQLVLTLVDHHTMSPGECLLEGAVCEVIDHRDQVKEFHPSVDFTLELVGSCCTLVAEKLLNDVTFDLDPLVAHLLLGTILLDTVCLSEAAGKMTGKDVCLVEKLEALLPDHSRHERYDALLNARQQISGLSALDVLRKDLKVISSDKMKIAVSSVPCLIEVFLAREDAESAIEDFTRLHHVDVVIVMAIDIAQSGQVHRQLAVHSVSPSHCDQVIDALMSSGPVLAVGKPIRTRFEHIHAFEQDNGKASRKKLLPFIEKFLRDGQSPEKGTAQDSTIPETLGETGSVPVDDLALPGEQRDAGMGPVKGAARGEAVGVGSSDMTHDVVMRPALVSCHGVMNKFTGNVVAMRIASDMERLKAQELPMVTTTDCSLNVMAGNVVAKRIAADMERLKAHESQMVTKTDCLLDVMAENVVAKRVAAEMCQPQEERGDSHLGEVLERSDRVTPGKIVDRGDFVPGSEAVMPCHPAGVLADRGTSSMKKTGRSVRYSDLDTRESVSCKDGMLPQDKVLAAAEQLVATAITSAVDLYLDSSAQQEYAHPEPAMRGNEEGTGHGNCQKGNEPNIKMGVNPTEQEDDHEGQLKDRTPGVGEEMKARRPTDLETTPKKKIVPLAGELLQHEDIDVSVDSSSSSEVGLSMEGVKTPDDLTTPDITNDSVFGSLDWESDTASSPVEPIPEYTAEEEFDDERSWKTVQFNNKCYRIDMKVIEPYKKVLSHGGYYGDGFNAIVVLTACHLPDKRRRDYNYVMDNLFLYVLNTLDLLVVDDYMIVYFHGAAPSHKIPSVRWLKRCYDLIDRRLRKNLKRLVVVHPTLWLKTVALMSRPFISSKFLSKLKYVKNLAQLKDIVPMEYIHIPDEVRLFDENKSSSTSSSSPT